MIAVPTMSLPRMAERGRALAALEAAGADVCALIDLDRATRRALVTDWPGRPNGPEPRWPWERVLVCPRHGELPDGRLCARCAQEEAAGPQLAHPHSRLHQERPA